MICHIITHEDLHQVLLPLQGKCSPLLHRAPRIYVLAESYGRVL